jgi:hypothetical protein
MRRFLLRHYQTEDSIARVAVQCNGTNGTNKNDFLNKTCEVPSKQGKDYADI